jgi:cell division septation protein DedD
VNRAWVINALSTQNEAEAHRTCEMLRDLPYQVYTYQAQVNGQPWHRIRIGFFASRQEARELGERLAKAHNLPSPWILKTNQQELARFQKPD